MFKVPTDPDTPTYDHTFTVSFWQWLTSSAADRHEWRRRRDAAIPTSRSVRYASHKAEQAQARTEQRRARER